MNTKTKALGISFGFHTLMALLAMWALSLSRPPADTTSAPVTTMMLLSMEAFAQPQTDLIPKPVMNKPEPAPVQKIQPKEPVAEMSPLPQKALKPLDAAPAPLRPSPSVSHETVAAPAAVTVAESKPVSAPAPQATVPAPVKELPRVDLSAEKRNFFASLRSKIQQNLRYPTSARRRGMEGNVDVRFVLESSGTIRDVSVKEGSEIFHNAAKLAVASASGIRIPEALVSGFPTEIDLTLEFRLN